MVNLEIVSLIVFVLVVGALLLRDRKNIKFHYGIIIRRWTKGLELIDKLVKRYPRFITILGNIGVGIGILAGLSGVVLLVLLTIKLQQTFALILPTAGGYQIPGPVISVPFWYWLLAIFIIATVHETMHAVYIRLEKVPVRNYGLLMLLILPIGAFVDPDENKIKKLATLKKLRIFAAGSFANFLIALLAIVVALSSLFLFDYVTEGIGIKIDSVAENSPAERSGLHGTIVNVNDKEVKNTFDFSEALNGTEIGDEITIGTDTGIYRLVLSEHPEIKNRTYIGITIKTSYKYSLFGLEGIVPTFFLKIFFPIIAFLSWLFQISLGVGIVNLLPIKPLDGGLFFGEIFTKMFKDKGKLIINVTTILLVLIILFNLFGASLLKKII